MLILNPQSAQFGAATLPAVTSVTIDRATVSPIEQWTSAGPWCALVDSPKRRVTITLKQELGPTLDPGPALGAQAELHVTVSPNRSDAARRRIRCTCVVTAVEHALPASPARPATRTVTLLAAGSPAADPVTIEEITP